MDEARLARLRDELDRARSKRDEWDAKVKELERRYREAEKTYVHNIMQAAKLTPEQLSELIRNAATGLPMVDYTIPGEENIFEKEEIEE